ncbi:efflux RND transporter periplasmic adaptor subunit [Sediminibacterium ginsengisoli]|uniref:RND family efflux transporter, MFP subunit n=1 Tax=Sediminibacterium ginsengisoli TaxID=413434 RepID=A0A1T4RHC1_9BACT|nr:efflux RND transporter periplasmic adaptor subunit [Sediminibacterium ginsengisoli]SKA15307.1 RND family efflux transporter, MFP subunit [Sediminibacterium ginsengisoli]
MQKIIQVIVVATAAITLAACGGKKEAGELGEKKAKLEQLRKQQTALSTDIEKLEKEIAAIDPALAKEEKPKLVTLATVAPETFSHFIDLQGKIESENISYVTPRGGGGQVKAIYVKRGDMVSKGQLLVKLDDAIAKQSVATAEQGLETLKTQLAFAKNLYQKQKNLWDQNIGTEVQLITAKNNVDNIENQLKSAQEQLKITKEQLQFSNVYAEQSGVAEDVNVRVGELFTGMNQIKIVNTGTLKVTTQIPENYLDKVKVGSRVKVTLPDINKTIDATVSVSGRLIDPNSRSFFVEAKIPADKDFRPNQVALVKIQDYTAPNAITVPVNTLQSDEKGKYVLVASKENGKLVARKKTVIPGELYGDRLEIRSGLQAGDVVITDGFQSLYEGQMITTDTK